MYRQEYPNPQFKRNSYECLNGQWEFEIGELGDKANKPLSSLIEVPFCPESKLSGIGHTDFINQCIYSRMITVSEADKAQRLVLHFGAVDHIAHIYLNGKKIFEHKGGYTPFAVDIAPHAIVGENRLTVYVEDDIRANVPSGKQSDRESYGCFYTRSTGIWQTVWLERTPKTYIRNVRFTPDVENCAVRVEVGTEGGEGEAEIKVYYEGKEVGSAKGTMYYRQIFDIKLSEKHLWELGAGRLYDVVVTFGEDKIESYFGLRSVQYDGYKFLLNGKSVYQRLVLDQGYYPDSIYTAPTEQDLVNDILLAKRYGFNGSRLHQKLFEPLFLYHCDKMGYMVWGEYASWGMEYYDLDGMPQFVAEWTEAIERDYNHPCIVTWCPLNETWMDLKDKRKARDIRFIETIYNVTKALDPTRPCVDVSGGHHGRMTDLFDAHCYGDPEDLKRRLERIEKENVYEFDCFYAPEAEKEGSIAKGGIAVNISEYGGVAYAQGQESWGYHTAGSEKDYVDGYIARTEQLLDKDWLCGFCYTQLYDVEQEQNGLCNYDRTHKISEESIQRIYVCNTAKSPIEE